LGESFEIAEFIAVDQDQHQERQVTEYVIDKIESSFEALSPKRKLLYQSMSVSMVALPLLYSVVGVAICAWWFYRKKIVPPVQILADATEHVSAQNLDFEVHAVSQDELGQLCEAFEKMRQTLYENNRELWGMIENRRTLQASVAHDLRNPIAIIEGYIEYMQQNIPSGKLSGEKLEHTLSNLAITAKRLERYTDYIRDLHALEETEIQYSDVAIPGYFSDIADGFRIMAEGQGKRLICGFELQSCTIAFDKGVISRILENVFSNALRYAKEEIRFCASLDQNTMTVRITDDGLGFSEHMLNQKAVLFYSEDTTGEHMGLGLATSRTLSQKHGGGLELTNISPHGACVKVTIGIKAASSSK
jgi:signal transduction histidine kinase